MTLMKISCLICRPHRAACQGRWWESRGRLLRSAPRSLGHGGPGWGLAQTGSSRRASRQPAVRAQQHRRRPHRCTSGHKGTEKFLTCSAGQSPVPACCPGRSEHGTARLLGKHRGFKCTKQVSRSSRRKLFLHTDQTQTTAPRAGEAAGLHWQRAPCRRDTHPVTPETTFGVCSNSGLCSLN